MSGPLAGKRVIDLSWGITGPLATMLMADYGADVIRVERPGGDPFAVQSGYVVWNRGKRGIALDLKQPTGLAVLDRLLAGADVLMESFAPGVADRLGIGYEALHERFPGLVYTSISAYGQQGSGRDRPGYDGLVQARMGIQETQKGYREGPIYIGFAMPSLTAAFLAVIGTMTAVYHRVVTGRGQHVDTSLRDGALAMLTMHWAQTERGQASYGASFWQRKLLVDLFQCSEGEWLHLHTGAQGAYDRLVEGIGLSEFMDKPQTEEMWDRMLSTAREWFGTHTREEGLDMLLRQDIPSLPVYEAGGALRDPQAVAMKFVETVHDPELGDLDELGLGIRFEKSPGSIRGSAPRSGQHTDEVLASAGYAPGDIADLREAGVV